MVLALLSRESCTHQECIEHLYLIQTIASECQNFARLWYGFWARSLGIYIQPECKTWEAELFGTIEPRSLEGKFSLRT